MTGSNISGTGFMANPGFGQVPVGSIKLFKQIRLSDQTHYQQSSCFIRSPDTQHYRFH
jgi:hypothetical protein